MLRGKFFVKGASSSNWNFLQGSVSSIKSSQNTSSTGQSVHTSVQQNEIEGQSESNIEKVQSQKVKKERKKKKKEALSGKSLKGTEKLSDIHEINKMDSNEDNSNKPPTVIHRTDYTPPPFTITDTKLYFDIYPDHTLVKSDLTIKRNVNSEDKNLMLDGVDLELKYVKINNENLSEGKHYIYKDGVLTVFSNYVPEKEFHFECNVVIHPEKNFALTGLYKSNALYVTQCESTGFRRITFFMDRPDVMSAYEVTICADKTECPVLLSNGDMLEEKDIENNRHCAKFKDYHPKPSYLFGLVAGQLGFLKDTYVTKFSKRKVDLFVYSETKYVSKLRWALESLKKSMAFDEDYFSLEYDLSRLNLVAVADFNMGAMENKGLNVFNVDSLLASKKTSTDATYERIVTVVSHEYFHNWTGNRVTLRDWFQLTLKEGLTVFREHLFSHYTVKSDTYVLDNVNYIRSVQFLEDASPFAHPVRPESYISMDNFYTTTVYEKGSQVMRMYFFILGEEYYKKGLSFYLKDNDGKGATCEDFNSAMEKAYKLKKKDENASLSKYMIWYFQSGTPHVKCSSVYDEQEKKYTITFKQYTEPTKDQPEKKALFIPIKLGLVDPQSGKEIVEKTLEFTEEEQSFVFENIPVKPLPSIFRDFSAPVHFDDGLTKHERMLLMKHDTNSFVIYNSSVMLYMDHIIKNYKELLKAKLEGITNPELPSLDAEFIDALKNLIVHPNVDYGVKAYMLSLPTNKYIMNFINDVDTDILYEVKKKTSEDLGRSLNEILYKIFLDLKDKAEDTTYIDDETNVDFDQINMRKLRNTILNLLSRTNYKNVITHIKEHSESPYPTNMLSSILCASYFDEYTQIFNSTYEIAQKDSQLLTSWLKYVALSDRDDIYDIIKKVETDIIKDTKNPNVIRAVYYAFAQNTKHFNSIDGKGYKLLAEIIMKTDTFNPQLAAQLCNPFKSWNKLNKPRQTLILDEINKILEVPTLSSDVKELLLRLTNKL